MTTIEAFRICLLPPGHSLPQLELASRSAEYAQALRNLLDPLHLGPRLEFMSVNSADGLWQVAMLTSAGQMPIHDDVPLLGYLDPELHREASSAGNLVFQTFNKLTDLINHYTFTPIDFDNFCTEHFGKLEAAPIRQLLRAAVRAGDAMQVRTPAGDYSLFNVGAAPPLVTEAEGTRIKLKVLDISLKRAIVKPHKHSAHRLGIRTRQVLLTFEAPLTCNSAIGQRLFEAIQQEAYIECNVHRISKISGEFHSLIMTSTSMNLRECD